MTSSRRVKKLSLLAVGALIALSLAAGGLLAACGPSEAPPTTAPPTTTPTVPGAPEAPAAPGAPAEEEVERIVCVGAAMGGVTTLHANMNAAILMKFLGIDSQVITHPSTTTSTALHERYGDIGQGSYTYEMAWTGTGIYEGVEPYKDLRALYYTGPTFLSFMVKVDSPLQYFPADLVGKRISINKPTTSAALTFSLIMEALGYDLNEDFSIEYLGWDESSSAIASGLLEGMWISGNPPHPTMSQLDLVHPLRILEIPQDVRDEATEKVPFLTQLTMSDEFYSLTEPTDTLGTTTFFCTHVDLPESIAHDFTKAYFDNPDFVDLYTFVDAEFIRDGTSKRLTEGAIGGIPYHVGALRYYNEIGWNIQESKYPPEWQE
jgi:TRAP transporter TAXI family solute receptor